MVEYSIKMEVGFIYTYMSLITGGAPFIFSVFILSLLLRVRTMLTKSSCKIVDLSCQPLKYFCKAWHWYIWHTCMYIGPAGKKAFLFSDFHIIHVFSSVRELTDVDYKKFLWRPASRKIAPWFLSFPFSAFKLRHSCVCFPLNKDYRVAIHNLYILTSILETSLNFSISNSPDPLLLDQILVCVWVFNFM